MKKNTEETTLLQILGNVASAFCNYFNSLLIFNNLGC